MGSRMPIARLLGSRINWRDSLRVSAISRGQKRLRGASGCGWAGTVMRWLLAGAWPVPGRAPPAWISGRLRAHA